MKQVKLIARTSGVTRTARKQKTAQGTRASKPARIRLAVTR